MLMFHAITPLVGATETYKPLALQASHILFTCYDISRPEHTVNNPKRLISPRTLFHKLADTNTNKALKILRNVLSTCLNLTNCSRDCKMWSLNTGE